MSGEFPPLDTGRVIRPLDSFPLQVVCRGRRDDPHDPRAVDAVAGDGGELVFECGRCGFDVLVPPIDLHDLAKITADARDWWRNGI